MTHRLALLTRREHITQNVEDLLAGAKFEPCSPHHPVVMHLVLTIIRTSSNDECVAVTMDEWRLLLPERLANKQRICKPFQALQIPR